MSFDFRKLLEGVTQTSTFRLALELAMAKVGQAINEHANDPDTVRKIGGSLVNDGSKVVDAVLHGTEVEQIADPPKRAPEPKPIKPEPPKPDLIASPPASTFSRPPDKKL